MNVVSEGLRDWLQRGITGSISKQLAPHVLHMNGKKHSPLMRAEPVLCRCVSMGLWSIEQSWKQGAIPHGMWGEQHV